MQNARDLKVKPFPETPMQKARFRLCIATLHHSAVHLFRLWDFQDLFRAVFSDVDQHVPVKEGELRVKKQNMGL